MKNTFSRYLSFTVLAICFAGTNSLIAQTPTAMTVPFVASNPTQPHTSWSGNAVTLKGTMSSTAWGSHTFTYDWNPGDGTAHCTGSVSNEYAIICAHTYTGPVGSLFTAILTVTDTNNNLVSPPSNCPPSITQGACYYTSLNSPPPNLPIEVNNAIDNGLWYLHTHLVRTTSTYGGAIGNWAGAGGNVDTNNAGDTGVSSVDCAAFENSGFLQTNNPPNPYSQDVALCVAGVFDQLITTPISSVTDTLYGSFNPDSNGNGIAAIAYYSGSSPNNGNPNYVTGGQIDAIVGTGTETAVVPSGTRLGHLIASANIQGSGTGGAYTYQDAVTDMVDGYIYCQAPSSGGVPGGGWHYYCRETTGDNSVSQWAAIGIIPATRSFGVTVPAELHTADQNWLLYSFNAQTSKNGYFGYDSNSAVWGPYATTPAGMVQLAMNGLGRGKTVSPTNDSNLVAKDLWDSAETYIRDNFGNPQSDGATVAIKDYYYGLFSFTKSMLLHDNSGTGLQNSPLQYLHSQDDPGTCASPGVPVTSPGSGTGPCYPDIDWYAAQTSAHGGTDPTDGVARTLVGNQLSDGSWSGQNYSSQQYPFQTAVAITMLNKTVFQPVPVACFTATPAQVTSTGTVTLDGNCSVDQNPSNTLVTWEWDVDGTGGTTFTISPGNAACRTPSCSVAALPFVLPNGKTVPYSYPVRLRVIDSGNLTADVVGNVVIANPPNPPTANAGGPYNFCPNTGTGGTLIYSPFLLNGSGSSNPDQGKTDGTPNAPPSTITAYNWDFACAGSYNSASGAIVNATSAFSSPSDYGSSFNVCLQVTNNDLCTTTAGQTANPPLCAFPTAATGTLTSVASAQVTIHNPTDQACTHCVSNLSGVSKAPTPSSPANVQLYWLDTNTSAQFPIDHYNIYRSSNSNFSSPVQLAGANSSPYQPAVKTSSTPGGQLYFLDQSVSGGSTYYYRVAPATASDTETCQGNVTFTIAIAKGR